MEENSIAAIEEIKAILLHIVRDGLKDRPDGVHLTWVGGEFARRKAAPFEQYVNFLVMRDSAPIPLSARKMAPFIQKYCLDVFDLRQLAEQTYVVRLTTSSSVPSNNAGEPTPTVESKKFKRGIWPAFIRPIEEGKRRFVNLDQFVFTDAARKPRGNWMEVGSQFVASLSADAPVDSLGIQTKISAWADDNGVLIDNLLATDIETANEGPSVSDLIRIIHGLPHSVSQNWSIPADVLRHLRNA
jgi:hypothetical protein